MGAGCFSTRSGICRSRFRSSCFGCCKSARWFAGGSRQPIPIDVRLIAATNVDLQDAVQAGKFREDLYYRLNVATLTIPPLRDRVDDIPPLADHFVHVYAQRLGAGQVKLADSAAERLRAHPWPGNIRELENVIHRALLVCREGRIEEHDLRLPVARGRGPERAAPSGEETLTSALLSLFERGCRTFTPTSRRRSLAHRASSRNERALFPGARAGSGRRGDARGSGVVRRPPPRRPGRSRAGRSTRG